MTSKEKKSDGEIRVRKVEIKENVIKKVKERWKNDKVKD